MSGTLNKVMLIGHTGDDVKMHYFEGGNSLGRFPLATNETYTNKSTNERITNTEWHNIVVRNKGAEICEKYLKKGDMVYIEGRLKTRKWQDEKGMDRYSTEVHCSDFKFLTPKGGTSTPTSRSNTNQSTEEPSKPVQQSQVQDNNEEKDDLPF